MNVQQLIDSLSSVEDKSREVWISVDEEGNDFKPLHEVDDEVVFFDLGQLAIVLWP